MMLRTIPVCFSLVGLLVINAAYGQSSLQDARESLLNRSPFVKWSPPVQHREPDPEPIVSNAGALSRELQFNGIMQIGDETYFNIFDKIENRSLLLTVDGASKGRFQVVDYDSSGDRSITVQAGGGRPEKIMLATSDGVSIPTATPSPGNNRQVEVRRTNNRPSVQQTERRRRVIPRRVNPSN